MNAQHDRILALLKSCQDRVYNICWQVLRHPQDAEDAAQEALLRILDGLTMIPDIRRFDPWMYRVALNVALTSRKRRSRRPASNVQRTVMLEEPETHEAVHDAIAALDDETRWLIFQHFFERRSMEEIARQRGCSSVAVWKRIDKAKAALKKSLSRLGFAAVVPNLDGVLSSVQPAGAPAHLISEAIVAKIGAVVSKAAAAAAVGGVIMTGGKGVSVGATIAVSALLLVIGVAGGNRIHAMRATPEPQGLTSGPPAARASAEKNGARASSLVPEPTPPAAAAGPEETLVGRLKRFGTLIRELEDGTRRPKDPVQLIKQEWSDLKPLAFADPAAYLSFLRARENEGILRSLLTILRTGRLHDEGANPTSSPSTAADIPSPILEGILGMFSMGTDEQKEVILEWCCASDPALEGALGFCLQVLASQSRPGIVVTLINALHRTSIGVAKLEKNLDGLRAIWAKHNHWQVRVQSLQALAYMHSPEADALFIEKLEEVLQDRRSFVTQYIPQILRPRLSSLKPGEEDRYVPFLKSAVRLSGPDHFNTFLSLSFALPLSKASIVLQEACDHAPNQELRNGVHRMLDLIAAGETRSPTIERAMFPEERK